MKAAFRKMNESIRPTQGLEEKVLEKITHKPAIRFRPLAAMAAMLVVVMLATPAMAASVPAVNDFLYEISPELAGYFTPIQKSTVQNGIKMEVLAASIYGDAAEIVVSFEDLEGDRVAEDFMPQFELRNYSDVHTRVSAMQVGWGQKDSGYDAESGTLTLRLNHKYEDMDAEQLVDDKITLTVDHALKPGASKSFEYPLKLAEREVLAVRVDMDDHANYECDLPLVGFGGGCTGIWTPRGEYSILTPDETAIQVTEETAVTGIAFVNGQLHIQTRSESDIIFCDAYLLDGNGEQLEPCEWYSFQIDGGFYKEAVFDITEAEMENYTLEIEESCYEQIEGPWKVTFAFTDSDDIGEHDDGIPMETANG